MEQQQSLQQSSAAAAVNPTGNGKGDLEDGQDAIKALKECRFDDREQEKKNFEVLYLVFYKFIIQQKLKMTPAILNEYLTLMLDVVQFIDTPLFKNFFANMDHKKIQKNLVKRCVVDPLTEKVLVKESSAARVENAEAPPQGGLYLEQFVTKDDPCCMDTLMSVLSSLLESKGNHFTDTLKVRMEECILNLLDCVKADQFLHTRYKQMGQVMSTLDKFVAHVKRVDNSFDYYSLQTINEFFRSDRKNPKFKGDYLAKLLGIIQRAGPIQDIQKEKYKENKYVRQVFVQGNKLTNLLKRESYWLLERQSHKFEVKDSLALLQIIQDYRALFCSNPNQNDKLDKQIKAFIDAQIAFHPDSASQFSQYQVQPKNNQQSQQKAQQKKGQKQQDEPRQQQVKNSSKADGPSCNNQTLEQFLTSVMKQFSDSEGKAEYRLINQTLEDGLKKVYADQLGYDKVQGRVFIFFDNYLGSRRTPFEARNAAKMMNSLDRTRILTQIEMDVLKKKQKRFLDKESVMKEKASIKKKMRDEYIVCTGGSSEPQDNYQKPRDQQKKIKGAIKFREEQDDWETDSNDDQEDNTLHNTFEEGKSFTISPDAEHEEAKVEVIMRRKDQPEDARNQKYLKNFRLKVADEHQSKYDEYKEQHYAMQEGKYEGQKAKKILMAAEALIRTVYNEQLVSEEDLKIRDDVIDRIKKAFYEASHKNYPEQLTGEIFISGFGSCQNGFWTVSHSDIDVTIIFKSEILRNQHQLVKMCSKFIKGIARQGTISYVPAAKVPLIKYEDAKTSMDVDLNVNNILGVYNSDLIYTYCMIDQRFHILGIFLKNWAKGVNIIGGANGLLSSYALTLMLIAFLQSRKPQILPCLQEYKLDSQKTHFINYPVAVQHNNRKPRNYNKAHKSAQELNKTTYSLYETDVFFEKDMKVIQKHYLPPNGERNTQSCSELLYEFLLFYLYEFNHQNMVISIKEASGFQKKYDKDNFPFSIIDPFDVQRNPGSTVRFNQAGHKKIMTQFRTALDRFKLDPPSGQQFQS